MQEDESPFARRKGRGIALVPPIVGILLGGCVGAAMPSTSIMLTSLDTMIHAAMGAALGFGLGAIVGLSMSAGRRE
jgi:hypothetical protein